MRRPLVARGGASEASGTPGTRPNNGGSPVGALDARQAPLRGFGSFRNATRGLLAPLAAPRAIGGRRSAATETRRGDRATVGPPAASRHQPGRAARVGAVRLQ